MSRYYFDSETSQMVDSASDNARSISAHDIFGPEADLDALSDSTASSALRMSAVWACVKVISESISALPLHVYRKDDGAITREPSHYLDGFLRDVPNEEMTWASVRTAVTSQLVLRGNSYLLNGWRRGRLNEVEPLLTDFVLPDRKPNGRMVYDVALDYSNVTKVVMKPDIAHFLGLTFDGVVGCSPISSYALASARAQQKHGVSTFEGGARLSGILSVGMRAYRNEDMRKQMRSEWENQMKLARSGTGTAILLEGTEYNPISMSLADSQFIEAQKFSVEEIARIFRVPMHKIGALDRATFNNIEQMSREFYTDTLLPWINFIESVLNTTWLTSAERKAGYCLRHDAREILKGDTEQRSKASEKFVLGGIMTPNEARLGEGLSPIEGGDELIFPLNHSTISEREAASRLAEETPEETPGETPEEAPEEEAPEEEAPEEEAPEEENRSALSALEPVLGDALRALAEREKKALARAHGKEDEGDRVEKFLADHLRAATLRLEPVAQAANALGSSLDAGELAQSLVSSASIRATGRHIDHPSAEDILSRL